MITLKGAGETIAPVLSVAAMVDANHQAVDKGTVRFVVPKTARAVVPEG